MNYIKFTEEYRCKNEYKFKKDSEIVYIFSKLKLIEHFKMVPNMKDVFKNTMRHHCETEF